MRNPGMGHIFLHLNRNKRSVVLDLKQPRGREALLRLASTSDVLVYNVRPQAMARLKLTYDDLRAVNSRIIYVGSYGFSQDGPYAAKPAYDDLIQGMVALPTLMQRAGADRPRFVPSTVADRITGLNTVNAITTALFYRERTGKGQAIEVPMFESLAQSSWRSSGGGDFRPPIGRWVMRGCWRRPQPVRHRDGYICLSLQRQQWRSFFHLLGRDEMFENDTRFSTQSRRSQHIAEVYAFVAEKIRRARRGVARARPMRHR